MILKIILCVFGGLVLLIAFLLSLSIKAYIEYKDGFTVKVKYWFITLYPRPVKKAASLNRKNKSKQTEKPGGASLFDKTAKKTGLEKFASDVKKTEKRDMDFAAIMRAFDNAKLPLKRFIRKLRVERLRIVFAVGGEDAAKIAVSYGLQSAAAGAFLAWLDEIVILQIDEVNITADFLRGETKQEFSCRVRARLFTAVVSVVRYSVKAAKSDSGKS
ncbi:MAG: DUF2953 domain-containing protein [Oscillospiraceae bacterium]|jgi:hypothetical protein|nr:DUF2953 domain-containing protein [Oscillospiraceae bacterium]